MATEKEVIRALIPAILGVIIIIGGIFLGGLMFVGFCLIGIALLFPTIRLWLEDTRRQTR